MGLAILSRCDVYSFLFDGSTLSCPINLSHAATNTPPVVSRFEPATAWPRGFFFFRKLFLPVRYLIKKT
jgi:hypothetical protein